MRHECLLRSGARGLARLILGLLCLALLPLSTQAGELHLILNGKAIHLEDPATGSRFNENNWGAGVQYNFDPMAGSDWVPFWTIAGFNDSHRNPSFYGGGGLMRRFTPSSSPVHMDLGFVAFLMTREDFQDNRPFPGVLPVMTIGTEQVSLNLTYVPDIHPKTIPLIFLQLKIRLLSF